MIKKVIRKLFGEKEEQIPSSISERESSTNSVYADMLGIKPLDRKMSPKLILQDVFPSVQWNISGGWGYSQDEATIIQIDNTDKGIEMEYAFLQGRTYLEAIAFMPEEQRFAGIEFEKTGQSLFHDKDGKPYDVIKMKVIAFKESDYEFLKNDWETHNAYEGDEVGMQKHNSLRNSKQIEYEITGWFDISAFFGKW